MLGPLVVNLDTLAEHSRRTPERGRTAMAPFNTASLATLSAAVLRGPWPAVKTLKGTDLWSDGRPTVVYTIRRLG